MFIFLAIFATFRLARLVAWDKVFDPLRRNLGIRASGSKFWRFFADLAHCPYCLGIWFALLCAELLWTIEMTPQQFILTWLGIAGCQFILQHLTDDEV